MFNGRGITLIGLLTLGTSPREDLENVISPIISRDYLLLRGALDNLTKDEIVALCDIPGSYPLFVRTVYGSFTIQREALLPLLTNKAREMSGMGVKAIILLCSGDFEPFPTEIPLMIPARLVEGGAKSIAKKGDIGIIVPVADQVPAAKARWRKAGFNPIMMDVNPTTADAEEIVNSFEPHFLEQIVLDCIGYSPELQKELSQRFGLPVWLPLTLAARIVTDLYPEIRTDLDA